MRTVLHPEHKRTLGHFLASREHGISIEEAVARRAAELETELSAQAGKLRAGIAQASGNAARVLEAAYLAAMSKLALLRRARALAQHTIAHWRGNENAQ